MSILLKVEVLTFKLDKLCFANALLSKGFSIIYYPFTLINNRVTSSAKGDTIDWSSENFVSILCMLKMRI